MSNSKNEGTNLHSACGAEVSKAHYFRNVARTLMHKTLGLTEGQKAQRAFDARVALTKALQATPEGRALLNNELVLEADVEIRMANLDPTKLDADQFGQALINA